MTKLSIILFNDFDKPWYQDILYSLEYVCPGSTMETNKRGVRDIDRYSLELRMDTNFILWCRRNIPLDTTLHYFNPDKEIPIIQLEEGTTREVFSIRKK